MGKASRSKKERRQPIDYLGRLRREVCLRCGGLVRWPKPHKLGTALWCMSCRRKVLPWTAEYDDYGPEFEDWLRSWGWSDSAEDQVDRYEPDNGSDGETK